MKKYIMWDPAYEEKVLKKLNTRAQEAYNKWMSDIRGGRDKTAHKIIPTAVLGAWKRAWSSNDAQKRSKTAKTNRRRGNLANNPESTYTGGSRSFMETAKKLKWGTYEWAHTRKHDKKSSCNMKATRVADRMKHIEERMSQLGDNDYSKDEAFLSLVPLDKKKRIFGLGSLASTVPTEQSSFNSDGRTPTVEPTDMECIMRIEHEQQIMKEQNMTIMEQLRKIQAHLDRRNPEGDTGAPPIV
ncbi:uncharacterized protein LOC127256241 isoform X2 [Andrographis paniculata]|uniref:uncharacterized protein LOC127256241 isoform X2 n=1 Tax=Andrographis paniculata TaxID=175694 RepID=UPI0021E85CF0|nr:uncharacterized protein LOC127256241 isoform X2 [Andrographis paniculata]XP_051138099.1 uncharacterized protein LOC127256241 isoform X2 [Andrographis paniculata]XP_051138100.1 uncharacterized protein LOC127256241 isoform X2 [Andrographis paniculata]